MSKIKAIKGLGKAFLKRAKDKAASKKKELHKSDIKKFDKVFSVHTRALKAANKQATKEYDKKISFIQKGIKRKGFESKEDSKEMIDAGTKLTKALYGGAGKNTHKEQLRRYKHLPDIRQRFRAEPGPKRKLTKGVKDWPTRAEILQKDRLKKYGKSKDH
jgi:hypothetical protein